MSQYTIISEDISGTLFCLNKHFVDRLMKGDYETTEIGDCTVKLKVGEYEFHLWHANGDFHSYNCLAVNTIQLKFLADESKYLALIFQNKWLEVAKAQKLEAIAKLEAEIAELKGGENV